MIFRIHTNKEYITTSIYHLRDTSLSLQAMGMLSFMLSCADNFKFSVEGLSKISSSKETRVRSALEELKEKKYLHVSPLKDKKGHIIEWSYDIYESPQLDLPDVEKQDVDFPHLENKHIKKNQLKEESIESYPPLYISPQGEKSKTEVEVEEVEVEEAKPKKPKVKIEKNPLNMDCVPEDLVDVVNTWLNYKKEKQQTYKQSGFNAMVKKLIAYSGGDPQIAQQIIDNAMAANYMGFFPLKNNGQQQINPIVDVIHGAVEMSLKREKYEKQRNQQQQSNLCNDIF